MAAHALFLLVLLPLATAGLLMCLPERLGAAMRPLAAAVVGGCLLMASLLVGSYSAKNPDLQFVDRLGSGHSLLGADGMSLVFLVASLVVALIAMLEPPSAPGEHRRRTSGWLVLAAGASGALAAMNLGGLALCAVVAMGGVGLVLGEQRPATTSAGALPRGLSWLLVGAAVVSLLVMASAGAAGRSGGGWLAGTDLAALQGGVLPGLSQAGVFASGLCLVVLALAFLLLPLAGAGTSRSHVLAGSVLLMLAVFVLLRVALPLAPDASRAAAPAVRWAFVALALGVGVVALSTAPGAATVAGFGASQTALVVAGAATLVPDGLSGAMVRQPVVALSMAALACLSMARGRVVWTGRMAALALGAVALLATEGASLRTGTRLQLAAAGSQSPVLVAAMEVAGVMALFAAVRLAYAVWSGTGDAGRLRQRSAVAFGWLPAAAVVVASLVPGPVLERLTVPALKVAARLDASYKGAFEAACDTTVTDEMKAANPANQFLSAAPCGPNGEPLPASSVIAPPESPEPASR